MISARTRRDDERDFLFFLHHTEIAFVADALSAVRRARLMDRVGSPVDASFEVSGVDALARTHGLLVEGRKYDVRTR